MAKVVIIGAGFAGHTAALYLGDKLGKKHTVTMVLVWSSKLNFVCPLSGKAKYSLKMI